MDFVAWKTARVHRNLFSFSRLSFKLAQRIEPLEFEATVVAKQLMQAGHLKNEGRILVTALNVRALAAATRHRSFESRVLWTLIFGLIRRQVYLRFTIYDLRFFGGEMGETILTNGKRLRPDIFFGAVASR